MADSGTLREECRALAVALLTRIPVLRLRIHHLGDGDVSQLIFHQPEVWGDSLSPALSLKGEGGKQEGRCDTPSPFRERAGERANPLDTRNNPARQASGTGASDG